MSHLYSELANAIIVLYHTNYDACKEYIRNNFPNNQLILWRDNEISAFEENKHYLCMRQVPHFSVEPPNIEGSWRYAPVISKGDAQSLYNDPRMTRPFIYRREATVQPMFPKNCKVSFLNTEHLSDKYTLDYIKRYLRPEIDVYDYSLSNIEILGRGKHLPYRITHEETDYLKKCLQATKKYDVCVVGNIYSDGAIRRMEKINELKRHGISVLVLHGVFGEERDRQIGEARILLNIHLYTHWRVYEAIRCERWRAAGMPIISEASINAAPSGITECSYDAIITTVKDRLSKMKSHWR
jgi:hypothetical protein